MSPEFHATTVLCVRKGGVVAMGGDGQVTVGETVMKANATKVRRLADGEVLAGFAGAVADAFTLFERFEESSRSSTRTCSVPPSNSARNGARTSTSAS